MSIRQRLDARFARASRVLLPLVTVALVGAGGCATNPVTGQRQFSLISESQEIRMGREYDPQIVAQMGLHPDSSLQQYVRELGLRMAALSERPNLPWSFRVLDDPLVNAFAVPGGFIYITRGILAHFNSEAELAAVLGHEIGHVTARHSATRMSNQQLAQIGLTIGSVVRPDLQPLTDLAGAGVGLLMLKYSRDDERQSDDLGLKYMRQAGFDPREMPRVFEMLEAVTQDAGGSQTPEWLASHPNPENRRGRILQQIEAAGGDLDGLRVGRDDFLRRLEGLVYGPNPREGYFRENLFLHPDMQFRFTFPQGWATQNQKQAVVALSPNRDAAVQITLAKEATPDAAAQAFFAQQGMRGSPSRTTINGIAAVGGDFAITTNDGNMRGTVAFLSHRGSVFRLLAYGPEARWSANANAAGQAVRSFQVLTDAAVLGVQPLRLNIVRLERPMTITEFTRAYSTPLAPERVALLNGVRVDETIPAGTLLKRVVGQPAR